MHDTGHVKITTGTVTLTGSMTLPFEAKGLVLFAHGSGSSRLSPRNTLVASRLNQLGLATLLFDLLTPDEEQDRTNVFDIQLLGERLAGTTEWARYEVTGLPIG